MSTLTIILLVYVALDIVCDITIATILRFNGWTLRELAGWLRNLLRKHQEDFIEDIVYFYGDNGDDEDEEEEDEDEDY